MAKTNPIGVRFNADLLKKIMEEQELRSPQRVLNLYEDFYHANAYEKNANALRTNKEEPKKENRVEPIGGAMPKGLSLQERIDWMEKNQKSW